MAGYENSYSYIPFEISLKVYIAVPINSVNLLSNTDTVL